MVLIVGKETEAKLLANLTPNATIATTQEAAIAAIDNRPYGFDVIVSSATLPDGSKASDLINYADRRSSTIPSVLIYSHNPEDIAEQQRAIPGAETILSPFEYYDYEAELRDIVRKIK